MREKVFGKLEFGGEILRCIPCLSLWEHPRVASLALRAIHLQVPRLQTGAERAFSPLSQKSKIFASSPKGGAKGAPAPVR